jgi:hypothetical protein
MDAAEKAEYSKQLLSLIPESGSSVGNVRLREKLKESLRKSGIEVTDQDYWSLRDSLIDEGLIEQGRGRGGSVHRIIVSSAPSIDAAPTVGAIPTATISEPIAQRILESDLYEPFLKAIIEGYVKENASSDSCLR